MDEAEATEKVQDMLLTMDTPDLWFSIKRGGIGSTSCSVILHISDADEVEYEYVVEARLVEDE